MQLRQSTATEGTAAAQVRGPNLLIHAHEATSRSKRQSIVQGGVRNLHVVLDFDHTVTSYMLPGSEGTEERCHECHDMLQHGPYRPEERRRAFRADIDAVWADQLDGRLSHISEWWNRFHDAIVSHRLTRDDVRAAVAASNTVLRPGASELFEWLRKHDVRTTIVSAGVTPVIEEFLGKHDIELHSRARIVANVPVFGHDSTVVGFDEPTIHSRNKPEALRHLGFDKSSAIAEVGQNIVLAGNSLGDVTCLRGMDHEHSFSFGFLHEEVHQGLSEVWKVRGTISDDDLALPKDNGSKLREFLQHYDVVNCGIHSDFKFLLDLFREIEVNHKLVEKV